jgi:hypothetical protein
LIGDRGESALEDEPVLIAAVPRREESDGEHDRGYGANGSESSREPTTSP